MRISTAILSLVLAGVLGLHTPVVAQPSTAFTYQGELRENNGLANGQFDMWFSLWDAPVGGSRTGGTIVLDDVVVSEGRFTVDLDYQDTLLNQADQWLQVTVDGFLLDPRTRVSGSPFSLQTRGIHVNTAGDVGIGTTEPSSLLHVRKQTSTANLPERMLVVDSHDDPNNFDLQLGSGSGILFKVPYQSDSQIGAAIDALRTTNIEVNSETALVFSTSQNDQFLDEAMRIDSQGRLGIGTTLPTQALDVSGHAIVRGKLGVGNPSLFFAQLTIADLGAPFAIDAASSDATLPTIHATNLGSGPVLWASGANDASPSGGGLIVVGDEAGANLVMDRNEIMARNAGSTSPLYLNANGGEVNIGEHRMHAALAYGKVWHDGSFLSGSSNITSVTRTGEGKYEIQIVGGFSGGDIPIASNAGWLPHMVSGIIEGGRLKVATYDDGGDADDLLFTFVVYRP